MFSIKKKKEQRKALIYISDCAGCGNCIAQCKRDAIGFIYLNGEKYARMMYPERCSGCGKCANVCENDAIQIIKTIAV